MLDDIKLRSFDTVVRFGSFTVASRKLGFSQSTVSQNVSDLEKAVGEPLLVRSRNGISLTPAGKLFLEYARKILFWYDRLNDVCINKTEAPASPMLLNLDSKRSAEISVEDGDIRIKLL